MPRSSGDLARFPSRGLLLKWCPQEGCQKVTHYLRSHLTHYHWMKPGQLLKTSLRVARTNQGIKEVQNIILTSTTTTSSTTHTNRDALASVRGTASDPATIRDVSASEPHASRCLKQESLSNGEDSDEDYLPEEDFSAYFECTKPSNDWAEMVG